MTRTQTARSDAVHTSHANALQKTLEYATCGAAMFEADGTLVFANAELSEMLPMADRGTRLSELIQPADRTTKAFVQIERFQAGKLSHIREKCQLLRTGEQAFWADISLARIDGDAASGNGLIILHLTNAELAEENERRISENNARWETALEAAGQGMWEFDRSTDNVLQSRGWKKLRGYAEHEHVPMDRESWLSRVHPDDRERINTTSEQQGAGDGEFETIEYRERHRDGHYVWIYSRGRPYTFDADGNPIKAIGTDTDITRLKTIEAELAAEKEVLRVTLQSIGDGVVSTDAKGHVLFLNAAAEIMTGWSEAEAVGKPVNEIFNSVIGETDPVPTNSAVDCLHDGKVHEFTEYTRLHGRDGKGRYIREKASPIRSTDRRIIGAVVVFGDATQRRAMQLELEHTATHDQLTGLPNRVALERQMAAAIAESAEDAHQHALCLIDLDHFKAVNDGAGHAAGDALLKQLAGVITGCCRASDCVARIGGDEFMIVLRDCNLSTARRIGQKIVESIAAIDFAWQEQVFKVGASIGVAQIEGKTLDADELYRQADAACYVAKRNGRGCVVVGG
jgi:diguanylate cyclase (GGDEF)-like protein/PAS domain S-box-containing protein